MILEQSKSGRFPGLLVGLLCAAGPVPGTAQIEEVVVLGDLDSLPDENVQSVFGFPKSLLHTPRSVSSISEEMIARFEMRDIDELIVVTPGSFTQSFFGVAGSLDIRGTPGETYFRGMRRLDNPGNYPTPHRRLRQRRAGGIGGRGVGERFQRACGHPLRQPRHAKPPTGREAPASQRP